MGIDILGQKYSSFWSSFDCIQTLPYFDLYGLIKMTMLIVSGKMRCPELEAFLPYGSLALTLIDVF